MRIICVGEHVGDPAVAAAVQEAYGRQAPYAAGIGSRHRDDPDREPRDRPRFLDMERARALAVRLILSGALDRHRGLKLISGHWGEVVPFFLGRLDDMLPQTVTGLSRTITQTYRDQVWVTPSGILALPQFHFVRALLGADRVLFSVDYPFLTMTGARRWLEELPVGDADRDAIAHGNAEALLHVWRRP